MAVVLHKKCSTTAIFVSHYYNKDTAKPNVAEIIIAKQRNGAIGTIELAWLPQYTKFANMKK